VERDQEVAIPGWNRVKLQRSTPRGALFSGLWPRPFELSEELTILVGSLFLFTDRESWNASH
jgi:hypothetical protein